MGIIIREADLIADRKLLLDILLRNREHGDNELRSRRFEWSYYQNPFGRPRAWLALDESSSRTIGMVAAFPRKMLINGKPVQGWNGGDTSIDKEFRTLGVAIKLRRAVQAPVDNGEMALLYSHPVDRMRVVLEKIGHQTIGKFVRHGAILRTEPLVQKILGRNAASTAVAGVANILPPLQWSTRFLSKQWRLRLQSEKKFGCEFDDLFARVAPRHAVINVRDAEFLHWRFVQNPLVRDVQIYRFERESKLHGYAIVGIENNAARILDLLVDGQEPMLRNILVQLIRIVRAQRISTLAVRGMFSSPIVVAARRLGFWFQDHKDAGVAVYTAKHSPFVDIVHAEKNWYMTQADRDV
ncbi:hypothetical protein HUU05_08540 [candidate division KSB1 bacterium]|nr:hypothetical protein [candidate division KSB1 bacterium]